MDDALRRAQAERRARGLARSLALPEGARHDFTSNDTLGFAKDPEIIAAGQAALARYGAGARASRLLGGGSPLDTEVEDSVAEWLGAEAALLFPSGYQANLGVVTTLAREGDVICSDARNHASLIDACRLSKARTLIFNHSDPEDLERCLRQAAGAHRRLILVEGVDSMEGDVAPLLRYAELASEHDAWLIVDEAHAAGVIGPRGAGAWRASGASDERLAARVVTGGKALGASGGLVVGSAALRQELLSSARSFVFSTGTPPATSGCLSLAVKRAMDAEGERELIRVKGARLAAALNLPAPNAAILPIPIGDNEAAVALASSLQSDGFDVRAVRPPTVPEGTARLRVVIHADHSEATIDALAEKVLAAKLDPTLPKRANSNRTPICVAGTDTEIGKTVVSALLTRALARRGTVRYWKPIQTGDDCDTSTVNALAPEASTGSPAFRYPRPASPHHAAESAGERIDMIALDAAYERERESTAESLLFELAGGLYVPLVDAVTNLDWIAGLRPRVILVARTGLGTLNHTLLSLEALRSRRLKIDALFLVGEAHPDNERTLRELGGVALVYHLPRLEPLSAGSLDAWLEENDLTALLGAAPTTCGKS
jgi:8-amino-7-oxononanoate synthase